MERKGACHNMCVFSRAHFEACLSGKSLAVLTVTLSRLVGDVNGRRAKVETELP